MLVAKTSNEFNLVVPGLNEFSKTENAPLSLVIGISVGGEKHEGKHLLALVEAINEIIHRDLECIIIVCDTLQRHNYVLSGVVEEEEALRLSKSAGDEWIERNAPILKKLNLPYSIARWNNWLFSKNYKAAFSQISSLFATSEEFRHAVAVSTEAFASRFIKRHYELQIEGKVDKNTLKECCQSYLLEECAIIMNLWPHYRLDRDISILYPGRMTKALSLAYENFVTNKKHFSWKKIVFKKIKVDFSSKSDSLILDLICNKLDSSLLQKESDRKIFLNSLACTIGVMESSASSEEKSKILADYAHSLISRAWGKNKDNEDNALECLSPTMVE